VGTTKTERKYKINKDLEETPDAPEKIYRRPYKVLIDNANFLPVIFFSYKEADEAGREFVKESRGTYDVV